MRVYDLYSASEAKDIAGSLSNWRQGKAGNEYATGTVKRNSELEHRDSEEIKNLLAGIHDRISASPIMQDFFVQHVMVPKFNRYTIGDAYDSHADAALMGGRLRTDYAYTLFLNDGYTGGELVVGSQSLVAFPGQIAVYECWRPHWVNPVRSGERICAIGWIQSLVRNHTHVELLGLLRGTLQEINRSQPEGRFYANISSVYSKLTKMWID